MKKTNKSPDKSKPSRRVVDRGSHTLIPALSPPRRKIHPSFASRKPQSQSAVRLPLPCFRNRCPYTTASIVLVENVVGTLLSLGGGAVEVALATGLPVPPEIAELEAGGAGVAVLLPAVDPNAEVADGATTAEDVVMLVVPGM